MKKEEGNAQYDYIEKKRTKFLGLPLYFTKYSIGEEKINIRRGFLTVTEDDAYMYKVQDVRLTRSLMERMFGLGTIICYTGDTTDPTLELKHIKHSAEIKEYLIHSSEEARLRRRTRYNVDVGNTDESDDDNED
ncbi:MAG: PH domain-containing protein [Lachnospiraceae bacterium]|mgnify:CR=1 FL=1|nr:PH domain-containing protein [Lachnospiraceae bacterium]